MFSKICKTFSLLYKLLLMSDIFYFICRKLYLAARKIRHQDASTKAALRASIALCAASLAAIFSLNTLE
jgi:hypothetical protein